MRWHVAGAVLASLLFGAGTAWACSFSRVQRFEVAPEMGQGDTLPPGKPIVSARVTRGNPEREDSCSDMGTIQLQVPTTDANGERVGYVVEVANGKLPSTMKLDPWPVLAGENYGMVYPFTDDGEATIDVTLRVRAVDSAGNLSEPTEVKAHSDGRGGCSYGGGGAESAAGAAFVLVSLLMRRRHGR